MPCAFQREPFHEAANLDNRKPEDIPLEFSDGPTSVLPPVTAPEAAKIVGGAAEKAVRGKTVEAYAPKVVEQKKKAGLIPVTEEEAKVNVEAVAAQPAFQEILNNPEKANVVQKAFEPTGAVAKAVPTMLKEGTFKAGAVAQSGAAAGAASVANAVAAEAAALGVSSANASANAQMGLMEQVLVEQFSAGKLAATVPEGTFKAGVKAQPAGVPQAGVAPTSGTNTKLAAKAVSPPTQFITKQMALASSMVAITLLESGFSRFIPKAVAKTPTASTVIKQAEDVVKSVPYKQFSSYVKGFLPF